MHEGMSPQRGLHNIPCSFASPEKLETMEQEVDLSTFQSHRVKRNTMIKIDQNSREAYWFPHMGTELSFVHFDVATKV